MTDTTTTPAAKAETKPKTPAKAPAKTAAPKTTKAPAIPKSDVIATTVNLVENLTKAKAIKLAHDLIEDRGKSDFELGGVLSLIQTNGWWQDNHETFKDYIEEEMGLPYRKAMYLTSIYNALATSGVPWAKVKDLGWTKLKDLAPILTLENVDEWVERAKNMTALQLIEAIKQSKSGATTTTSTTSDANAAEKVVTLTFKLKQDQKDLVKEAVDKMKEDSGTEYDSVAIERIAMQYLEGGTGAPAEGKQKTIEQLMKGLGPEEVLEKFEQVFPGWEITATTP